MSPDLPNVIAILGGTGSMGQGLARRWARAGRTLIIGSRDLAKAQAAAQAVGPTGEGARITGATNAEAAAQADLVVLTVPFAHQRATLEEIRESLAGKILIDVTAPLRPPRVDVVEVPPEGSAAKRAQAIVGEGVRVVSAFQNVSAQHLAAGHEMDCDVLVTGDDRAACDVVVRLAQEAGLRAWRAGPLSNAVAAEALTAVLIHISKTYKIAGPGIRVTGEKKRKEGG